MFITMIIEQIPEIIRKFYRHALWRLDKNSKVLYLTFDDGPNKPTTPWLLDELDRLGIKATFFCIGNNVEKNPDIYAEIIRRGHRVGSHGFGHVRGTYRSNEKFLADVKKAEQFIQSDLYRPPYGQIRPSQARKLSSKYKVVLWDVITRDYDPDLTPEEIYNIAVKYARNGSIIVFHSSVKAEKNMKYAFPKAVEYWKQQGYTFGLL